MSDNSCIVLAGNEGYAPLIGTALLSIISTNPDIPVIIYSDGMSDSSQDKLMKIVDDYYSSQLPPPTIKSDVSIFAMPDIHVLAGTELHIDEKKRSTYLRLFLPSILDSKYEKCLWLDGDVIVTGDLSELFKTELSNSVCAAVLDSCALLKRDNGFGIRDKYYNAGVLLFNNALYNSLGMLERVRQEIKRRNGYSIDFDQSFVNCVLNSDDNFLTLPPKYNVMQAYYFGSKNYQQYLLSSGLYKKETYSASDLQNSIDSPIVIHFAGFGLSNLSSHFAYHEWLHTFVKTPWGGDFKVEQNDNSELGTKNIVSIFLKNKIRDLVCGLSPLRKVWIRTKYGFWQKK